MFTYLPMINTYTYYNSPLKILAAILNKIDHRVRDDTLKEAADNTHGFVGSDLHSVCKEG